MDVSVVVCLLIIITMKNVEYHRHGEYSCVIYMNSSKQKSATVMNPEGWFEIVYDEQYAEFMIRSHLQQTSLSIETMQRHLKELNNAVETAILFKTFFDNFNTSESSDIVKISLNRSNNYRLHLNNGTSQFLINYKN